MFDSILFSSLCAGQAAKSVKFCRLHFKGRQKGHQIMYRSSTPYALQLQVGFVHHEHSQHIRFVRIQYSYAFFLTFHWLTCCTCLLLCFFCSCFFFTFHGRYYCCFSIFLFLLQTTLCAPLLQAFWYGVLCKFHDLFKVCSSSDVCVYLVLMIERHPTVYGASCRLSTRDKEQAFHI